MKLKLPHLLPLLLLLTVGCVKNNNIVPTNPQQVPAGTFSGHFTRYRYNAQTKGTDSASANLNLSMEPTTGFAITGDTSTLHAGSHGAFEVGAQQGVISFNDVTYPISGVPAKVHLSGIYNYSYNGTVLQLAAGTPLDTAAYYYYFKKTGN